MKTYKSTFKSAAACLNQVTRYSNQIVSVAAVIKNNEADVRPHIAEMRQLAESILQATHEFSAYYNVMIENKNEES